MVNADVFKTTIEDDLKEIAKAKLDILILQRQNENLCKDNNEKIKKFAEEIENRELSLEDNLSKSGEKKIETSAGWCAYRVMPDSWEYEDGKIIDWCKKMEVNYFHTVEVLEKMKLKKDILEGIVGNGIPGLTITPQEPKFNYKLNGGL